MSGITGLFHRDARPVDRADLNCMGDAIAHRGPDGSDAWCDGAAGLGHVMLWTTPESLQEKLPLVSYSGDLVITADARIDNREELISSLDLNGRPRENISDSELILLAYERWGENCPQKLLGDFAFAIWDKRRQFMFCARDHFGMKPFYYHASGETFAFGSEIKALLALQDVPRRVNETKVADFYANIFEDKAITFYEGILRLPPAHCLVVGQGEDKLWPYWALDASRELRLSSDGEYADAYRDIFTEAVRCRLRSAYPVGSTLSGGLDSSSIVCVSRELLRPAGNGRLHTFSCIIEDSPEADERPFINAVLSDGDLIPHDVPAGGTSPLTDIDRVLWHLDEPFFGMNLFLHWSLAASVQQQGVRVLLDGTYGDGTVSWGLGLMAELARKGRWLALARETREIARTAGVPQKEVLLRFAIKPATPRVVRLAWRRLRGRSDRWAPDAIINPDLARRVGLEERWSKLQADQAQPPRDSREEHWRNLTTGAMAIGIELANVATAAFAIDWRCPFLDRRLVEFCFSLPGEQKLHRGWTRVVARRGLAGTLPDEVRWRRDKGAFTENLLRSLERRDRERLEEVALKDTNGLGKYVNPSELAGSYRRFVEAPSLEDASRLFKSATLAIWLKNTQLAP